MIKNLAKAALHRLGYDIYRYRPWMSLHTFFQTWKSLGFNPRFVFDIGANHGDWTRAARSYFPEAEYVLIEPQEQLKTYFSELLRDPKIRWKNAGVSDMPGRLMLNLAARDDSATFRNLPNDASHSNEHQIPVEVVTLDDVVREFCRVPDLVKIDAEGFDLKVLRGATSLFGKTEVFLVECAVCGRDFENTLPAIVSFLDAHGYSLVDFTDLNRSPSQNVLWLCEAAFLRKTSPLWQKLGTYESSS